MRVCLSHSPEQSDIDHLRSETIQRARELLGHVAATAGALAFRIPIQCEWPLLFPSLNHFRHLHLNDNKLAVKIVATMSGPRPRRTIGHACDLSGGKIGSGIGSPGIVWVMSAWIQTMRSTNQTLGSTVVNRPRIVTHGFKTTRP